MYSFYGGRPGNSFVIITTYRSINDMVDNFKKGPVYTAVHYDEHVMINTVNKNDPDNGKIYRRGYDFNNDMGGAEFVGTIIGPSGNSPMVQMTTIAEVRRKASTPVQGYSVATSSGSYSPSGENLVPGKTVSNNFNDAIKWECCSIRNENNEDTTAYIGFTFPYLTIDVEASTVLPYINNRNVETAAAYRIDDYTHPFYEKWHFDIPKGIKGDSFKNLRIQVADNTIQPYEGQEQDIEDQNKVIVYDYYNYDNFANGNPKKYYLGPFNQTEQTVNNVYNVQLELINDNWYSMSSIDEIMEAFNNNKLVYINHLSNTYILQKCFKGQVGEMSSSNTEYVEIIFTSGNNLIRNSDNFAATDEPFLVTLERSSNVDFSTIAPRYEDSSTYDVGDIVVYNNNLYKCITAITTPSSWDDSCWAGTTVIEALKQ